MTSKVTYLGGLRTSMQHLQSGTTIYTDAPTDNHGKGEKFSPTDLCASSLAACMITMMGIKCDQLEINMEGTTAEVLKIMASDPRRISGIDILLKFKGIFDEKQKKVLIHTAETCPVFYSLHPDIKVQLSYEWE
ncbi:MAG TPA: OsmC family protein [Saprospiraceae bacterium]|nr:OsmC family protein [Saprospiraceae bacterium]HPK09498.1 OsmC family protein [Saprospiraceae bacterium]HRX29622.1 OsmC family protein [Saprospiraceae bacterium]